MKMIYKNKFGEIVISGEGTDGFSVLETDGLEVLGKDRSLVRFYNSQGYAESGCCFGQRVITISGDIKAQNYQELERAMRVFSLPGTLKIETDRCKREIYVNDAVFKTARENGMYKSFCLQMSCDMPHFTECEDIYSGVYRRENLITANTTFPAMFSKRMQGGIVENLGEVSCEPKLTVECLVDAPESGAFMIENKTTGGKIIINHKVQKGEIITVDIPKRTITSSILGDITNLLDPDSYLCDIYLECGENDIDVVAAEGNRNSEIYVIYRNRYAGVLV